MSKKASITITGIVIIAAIFLGFVFLNKSDGPVMGMILSDSEIESFDEYKSASENKDEGIFMIVSNSFNKYNEEYAADIIQGQDLYASVYFVESPEGSEFICRWINNEGVVFEEAKMLKSGPQGVISYMLEGSYLTAGEYSLEIYDGDNKLFEKIFSVD